MALINLWIKPKFLKFVGHGKDIEIRCGYKKIENIKPGDVLRFSKKAPCQIVVAVRKYGSFEEMLEQEDFRRIYPPAQSKAEVHAGLTQIYFECEEAKGVYAIEFKAQ